jgi:hypothetical protein
MFFSSRVKSTFILSEEIQKGTLLEANKFIPYYAFKNVHFKDSFGFYYEPYFKDSVKVSNTIKQIKDALETHFKPRKIKIGSKYYYFIKGAVYDENKIPLLTLALPLEKYLNPEFNIEFYDSSPFNYKDYVLFYSSSFFTNPALRTLHRRFEKEILLFCFEKGIEVKIVTSEEILANTFANTIEPLKFKSISQLEEYMRTVLPNYLYTEEEDTFVFEDLPERVSEELSVEEEALLFDVFETTGNVISSYQNSDSAENIEDLNIRAEREGLEREAATWFEQTIAETVEIRSISPIELIDDTE